jgi:hypothetical protein
MKAGTLADDIGIDYIEKQTKGRVAFVPVPGKPVLLGDDESGDHQALIFRRQPNICFYYQIQYIGLYQATELKGARIGHGLVSVTVGEETVNATIDVGGGGRNANAGTARGRFVAGYIFEYVFSSLGPQPEETLIFHGLAWKGKPQYGTDRKWKISSYFKFGAEQIQNGPIGVGIPEFRMREFPSIKELQDWLSPPK